MSLHFLNKYILRGSAAIRVSPFVIDKNSNVSHDSGLITLLPAKHMILYLCYIDQWFVGPAVLKARFQVTRYVLLKPLTV